MIQKAKVVFILILLWHTTVSGQENLLNLKFRSIGVNEGLSQNSVWDVLQTHDGFLWIGTSDGLNRYDGSSFKIYKHEEGNPCSISGQNFPRLYEDKMHQMWVSDDHGLCFYNKARDCFETLYLLDKTPMEYYSNSFVGENDNNELVVFLGDKHVAQIDIKTHKISKIREVKLPADLIRLNLINPPVLIGKTAFLSLENFYLLQLDINSLEYKLIRHPFDLGISLLKHSENELIFIYGDSICLYNFHNGQRSYTKLRTGIKPLNDFTPVHVLKYRNRYWYSSKSGIMVFDPQKMEFVQQISSFSSIDEEDYQFITATREDLNGNLWICSNGDGVKLLSRDRNKFEHYRTKSKRKNLIKAICSADGGKIYTSSYQGQIVVFDPKNGRYEELNIIDPDVLVGGSVTCLGELPDHKIICVVKNNIVLYNPVSKKHETLIDEKTFKLYGKHPRDFASYSCYLPVSEKLAFVNIGNQVLRLNFEANGKIDIHSIFEFRDNPSTGIQFDNSGNLWLGTNTAIYLVDTSTKAYKPLLNGVYAKCILNVNNGYMYVATQRGVYVFLNGVQTEHYTTKNGLPADFTYGLLEDKKHRIWISHNKGLSCFDPITKTFKNYTIDDGLQSNEFNTGAYFKDEKGKLYFGGINGLNAFDPLKLYSNKKATQVEITEVKIFEVPLPSDSNICAIHQLNFPFDSNTLSFDFAGLEFSNPSLIQYAYKLDGYDKDWIYSGNKHFARYANLPFGIYTFSVKAANSEGMWSVEPKELQIIIRPPFWRTMPFYFLSALMFFLTLGATVYFLIRQQKIKQKRKDEIQANLENERLRIARDLHDNVGAQLSYLITNIDWMLEHPDALNKEEANKRFNSLSEAGKQAIITLRQTIWAINNKELSVEDFADRFKQFMIKMLEFNTNIHLELEEEIDETIVLSPGIALNLFRVCQEAFNNCLKHAQCKRIKAVFKSSSKLPFYFLIEDDGIGFETTNANKKGHYGLENMHARAEESGATITIDSIPGIGTKLSISLK